MNLDYSSATPLYVQLKDILLAQIKVRDIKGGNKLPTEIELCKTYNICRNTVRNAIDDMVKEGYLIKKQGKGTYVQHKKIGEDISSNLSFSSVCIANGMIPSNKLITVALQPASEADIKALNISPGSKVLYLSRVLCADGVPVIYDRLYIKELYSDLIKENLDDISIYSLFNRKYGIILKHSHKIIELAYANEEEAMLMDIKKGDPVLLMNEIVYDIHTQPVHRTKQIILGDRFKYEVKQ